MLAVESFLADIAQNVAGNRVAINVLLPIGVDPHGFEPTPSDLRRVADANVLIVNGAGFEDFLDDLLKNAGGKRVVIEASAGLTARNPRANESANQHAADPHFWFDPNHAIKYVENIREGLTRADPDGAAIYRANADAYSAQLRDLDAWIADQIKTIPPAQRQLVTDHDTFGYFADRYDFQIVGMIVPSVHTGATPSAQEMARVIERIKQTRARAIFLEAGANAQLAQQIAQESGARVITGLYTHSLTDARGNAPTYIEMMKFNTRLIVDALK